MQKSLLIKQIHSHIEKARNALLLTHESPDIDAVSSVFAFSHYLKNNSIAHSVFFKNIPKGLFDEIMLYKNYISEIAALRETYDVIVVFDSGDTYHTGIEEILQVHKKKTPIINIDHHPTNTFFGHINLIETSAVSTTEILFDYFIHHNITISKDIALYLIAGILGDTNNFTNHNTTSKSIEAASRLMQTGLNINKISNAIKQKKPIEAINSWGEILSRLTIHQKHNIATTVITKKDLEKIGENQELLSGISNYLNNISNVKISMVVKEGLDGIIKISMRSNNDLIDLSKFAKIFNGGGHKKAAGFSIKGRLMETEKGWKII